MNTDQLIIDASASLRAMSAAKTSLEFVVKAAPLVEETIPALEAEDPVIASVVRAEFRRQRRLWVERVWRSHKPSA